MNNPNKGYLRGETDYTQKELDTFYELMNKHIDNQSHPDLEAAREAVLEKRREFREKWIAKDGYSPPFDF